MLEEQLREAFSSFARSVIPRYARERELVSTFIFAHPLPTVGPGRVLNAAHQIGIEVAVPQRRDLPNPRRDPDVCKDIVIWPSPGMTCWDEQGRAVHYPLAVLEWKSINLKDRKTTRTRKRVIEHASDVDWLRWYVDAAPGATGYAVLVDLSVPLQPVIVHRLHALGETSEWFISPERHDVDFS